MGRTTRGGPPMMSPLVLIPGMMCDARLFGPQIAALCARWPLHLPPITQHETVEELASAILSDAPPYFALAGLSMGGIVAMEVFAQAPGRVARMALLDTNPKAETDEIAARRAPQIERVRSGHLPVVMRDEVMPHYLAEGCSRRDDILGLCTDMAMSLGPDVFARQSRALRSRPDRQQVLARIDVPTLILCGAEDRLCPPSRHTLMHDLIPGSRLIVIENAGHLPTLEQPEKTTAEFIRWLEE